MKTVKFRNWDCDVRFAKYNNGRTAIKLQDKLDGEPIATATVNLPDVMMKEDEVAIKDYSENEGMLNAFVKAGIVGRPFMFAESGFVAIPICKLLINPIA